MPLRNSMSGLLLGLAVGLATAGCVSGPLDPAGGTGAGVETQVDLDVDALLDVNPTSASYDQPVHPADFQGQLSVWYFGHAT